MNAAKHMKQNVLYCVFHLLSHLFYEGSSCNATNAYSQLWQQPQYW